MSATAAKSTQCEVPSKAELSSTYTLACDSNNEVVVLMVVVCFLFCATICYVSRVLYEIM